MKDKAYLNEENKKLNIIINKQKDLIKKLSCALGDCQGYAADSYYYDCDDMKEWDGLIEKADAI